MAARSVISPPNRDFILIKSVTATIPLGIFPPGKQLPLPSPPPPPEKEIYNFLKFKGLYLFPIFFFHPEQARPQRVFQHEGWDWGREPGTCRPAAR